MQFLKTFLAIIIFMSAVASYGQTAENYTGTPEEIAKQILEDLKKNGPVKAPTKSKKRVLVGYAPAYGNYNYVAPVYEEPFTCVSFNFLNNNCRTPGPLIDAKLQVETSGFDYPCKEGWTWGKNLLSIWVKNGCSGLFRIRYQDLSEQAPRG